MLEDKWLIWKLKGGSRDALRRIYEKYRCDLLRIAAGLLSDAGGAEDVVHDVFIGFAGSVADFELRGSLRGYLTTCVANRARNVNRWQYRQKNVSLDEVELLASRVKRPDEWLIFDEEFERVRGAMAELPYEQREAVVLRIQGRMKFHELAALQETSLKTVQSRYRYGLEKLRSLLDGEVK